MNKEISTGRFVTAIVAAMLSGGLIVLVAGYFAADPLLRAYILNNPDVIIESVQNFDKEQQREIASRAVSLNYDAIYNDEMSVVAGNPNGDVTLVEFFDYKCGFCKRALPDMVALLRDENLRVIYKEYPILGPESVIAAKAALASREQGKYLEFHHAMMAWEGEVTRASIMSVAEDVGLDTQRLVRDMENPYISEAIQNNLMLANNLDVSGTPTFVIGSEIIEGAVGMDALQARIRAARGESPG